MKGLDGIQGLIYVGMGCVFEGMHFIDMMLLPRRSDLARPAIAGLNCAFVVVASDRKQTRKGKQRKRRIQITGEASKQIYALETIEGVEENGGLLNEASTSSLLKEAIHVISCGYEDKTKWGNEWGGVGIDDWWRNEQFWVIRGASSHVFALFQGLLKVLAGVETSFTVTSKAGDDAAFYELYIFKWTSLLIPPMTLLMINIIGVVVGVLDAINNGYDSWGPLFGRQFFALWVIIHLYPFLKGLMGKQERTPTIVVVWSILLASILTLLWGMRLFVPFVP
ncbi:hypothetical protein RND71_044235 [Anisodus tanguticus]|uniref:Uncharacterized protein n=1 Tax=Anisodus tanguticus TaxID=243964 RepID=A0AAE1QNA9_9SOLA|nr:hypothetical protein RND71_044235 [Anisodus tanguticus]